MRRGLACAVAAGLLAGAPVGTAGAEDLAPLIKPLLDKITELRKARKLEDGEVAALKGLIEKIEAADCRLAESPVSCQVDALEATLGPLRQALTAALTRTLTKADSAAIDRLVNAVVDAAALDPNIAAARVARILAVRLAAAGVKLDQRELAEALAELAALVPAKADPPKVINVIGAFYGDLDAIRVALVAESGVVAPKKSVAAFLSALRITDKLEFTSYQRERFCSATQAIRARCQGHPNCLGGNDGVNGLQPAQLCGYSPAPYAESRFKGLVIAYQCVPQAGFKPFEAWRPEAAVWPPQANAQVEAGTKGRAVEAAEVATIEVRWVQFRPDQIAKIVCDGGAAGGTPPKTGAAAPPTDDSGAK